MTFSELFRPFQGSHQWGARLFYNQKQRAVQYSPFTLVDVRGV